MSRFQDFLGGKRRIMVTIKNVSNAMVYIVFPDLKIHRQLRPNQSFGVTAEDYDQMVYDPGFSSMMDEHYISVKADATDKPKNAIPDSKIYDVDTIVKMYETKDYTNFTKFIRMAAPAEKDIAVQKAVDMKITDNAFVKLIKDYCGVDVINSINIEHQLQS